jgi:hypothetical protein
MKICKGCNIEKKLNLFGKNKSKPDGINTYCKECVHKKAKIYKEKYSEKVKKSLKKWRENNQNYRSVYRQQYYQKNKKLEQEKSKAYREKNKQKIYTKEKEYRQNNRDTILRKKKEYFQKNKHKHAKYHYERRKQDPLYRIQDNLRRRLRDALKGNNKSAKTMELIGCSVEVLWSHIESQFTTGMTKENYGVHGWHIDHIIPCDSFDFSDPEQQKQCFHYTNLQPLWAKDNIAKSNKICKK